MDKMTRDTLLKELQGGQFATVKFIKRTTQEERVMNCRIGVKKHLAGGQKAFDDEEKNLITVFDTAKGHYRSINCDSILEVHAHGKRWTPDHGWVETEAS